MTTRRALNPSGMWDPGDHHLSQVVTVHAPSTLVYVSGQTALGADGLVGGIGNLGAQTRLCFDGIRTALRAVGGDLANLTALTVHVVDISELPSYTAVLREYVPSAAPTQTVVEVARLAVPEMLIEITAHAAF